MAPQFIARIRRRLREAAERLRRTNNTTSTTMDTAQSGLHQSFAGNSAPSVPAYEEPPPYSQHDPLANPPPYTERQTHRGSIGEPGIPGNRHEIPDAESNRHGHLPRSSPGYSRDSERQEHSSVEATSVQRPSSRNPAAIFSQPLHGRSPHSLLNNADEGQPATVHRLGSKNTTNINADDLSKSVHENTSHNTTETGSKEGLPDRNRVQNFSRHLQERAPGRSLDSGLAGPRANLHRFGDGYMSGIDPSDFEHRSNARPDQSEEKSTPEQIGKSGVEPGETHSSDGVSDDSDQSRPSLDHRDRGAKGRGV